MLKVSVIAAVFFTLGFFISNRYHDSDSALDNPNNAIQFINQKESQSKFPQDLPAIKNTANPPSQKNAKTINFVEPKTQFGYHEAFNSLEKFSADEIAEYLLSIDEYKTEMRAQIAWFLSGKYPEKAFDLLNSNLVTGDVELAKILAFNLSNNHPDLTYSWLKNNDNIFNQLFSNQTEKYQFKLINLQTLSKIPEFKWDAYEKGRALINNGPRGQDKYSMLRLAQYTASSNPLEAINYALSKADGHIDTNLLNGALTEFAKRDPTAASQYILENEDSIDPVAITATTSSFIFKDRYDEAFTLVDSLKNSELKKNTIGQLASNLVDYGKNETNGLKLIQSLKDNDSKVIAASSLLSSMSVVGYPVEKQIEILDQGLTNVPVHSKSWEYAWTLKKGYGKDSDATKNYIRQLQQQNPELAKVVSSILKDL